MCVQEDNLFKCVCKDDYEEPDCRLGKEYILWQIPTNDNS
jgi:hypothetical protein